MSQLHDVGKLDINTENILPIIKKWLYSDHEIFLRELVSNAYDAINKLRRLSVLEGCDFPESPCINIIPDMEKGTLTISDSGLGLDADEMKRYIAQIAFSSAEEFAKKLDAVADSESTIGHFGLGFYSSFMVSDKVEVRSLSYKPSAKSVIWSCDGGTEYQMSTSDRTDVGTDIILYINKDNKEFLEEARLTHLVKKYTNFLPIDIQVNGKCVNEKDPLWIQSPTEVQDEAYIEFYKKLFPYQPDPLFWVHLNIDYPFNLQGILYFPKILHELDSNRAKIHLYCKQVFVSDSANDIIPEFLTLLQGAIDCPDIPLNVSRSYLQNDLSVQKISKHIVKKVADKLVAIYNKNKAKFESLWNDIGPFIKYGMMNHEDFYEKVKDLIIFESTSGYFSNVAEYLERNKDKTNGRVFYCTDRNNQAAHLKNYKDSDIEVLLLHSLIDVHFLQFLEGKNTEIKYVSIDSEISEGLIDEAGQNELVDKDNKTGSEKIEEIFKNVLNNDKIKLDVKPLKSKRTPGMVLESEHVKRLKTLSHFSKSGMAPPVFEDITLLINQTHPLIKNLSRLKEQGKMDLVKEICLHVFDLAKLSKSPLSGEEMEKFVERSSSIMQQLSENSL